jgi:hypothetical protein
LSRISPVLTENGLSHQIDDLMKTTNFRTVEELNLDANAPTVTPTKVQNDKIARALKKLSVSDPDETLITKMVGAFVALGINPQAKFIQLVGAAAEKSLAGFRVGGSASPGGDARVNPGGG